MPAQRKGFGSLNRVVGSKHLRRGCGKRQPGFVACAIGRLIATVTRRPVG